MVYFSLIVNVNHQDDKVYVIHTHSVTRTAIVEVKILGEYLYVCSYLGFCLRIVVCV